MASQTAVDDDMGWTALDLSFSGISGYISDVGIGPHSYCFLMDETGNIVYHPPSSSCFTPV